MTLKLPLLLLAATLLAACGDKDDASHEAAHESGAAHSHDGDEHADSPAAPATEAYYGDEPGVTVAPDDHGHPHDGETEEHGHDADDHGHPHDATEDDHAEDDHAHDESEPHDHG